MGRDTRYAIVSKANKNTNIIMMRDIYDKGDAERLARRFPGDHFVINHDEFPKNLGFNDYKYTVK